MRDLPVSHKDITDSVEQGSGVGYQDATLDILPGHDRSCVRPSATPIAGNHCVARRVTQPSVTAFPRRYVESVRYGYTSPICHHAWRTTAIRSPHSPRRCGAGSRHGRPTALWGMDNRPVLLELVHLSRRFGSTIAVDNANLRIDAGEMVGIIGRSGAGKSTLPRLINRMIEPTRAYPYRWRRHHGIARRGIASLAGAVGDDLPAVQSSSIDWMC